MTRRLLTALTTFGLAIVTAASANAALPPHAQRQAEFQAAIAVAANALGIEYPIDSITRAAPDRFEVRAGSCMLVVTIVGKPSNNMPGPRQFEAVAGDKICR